MYFEIHRQITQRKEMVFFIYFPSIIALRPRFRPFQQGNYFTITQNALVLIQYVGRKLEKIENVGYMVIALLDIEFDTICRAESSGFENQKIMVQNCNEKVLIYSGNTILYLLLTILYHLFEPLNSLYLDFVLCGKLLGPLNPL